jgi:hypothetical protein
MSEIRRYVLVNAKDQEEDCVYDTSYEAITDAERRPEPMAVIARVFTFDDSELVWTSTGDNVWPPASTGEVDR